MKTRLDLKQQGVELCQEHAGKRIKGDLLVESTSEKTAWDPIELRHMFDQSLVIWRRVGAFEVILDSLGRLAGFVDHDKYATSKDGELKPEEADALLAAVGVVPKGSKRTDFKERTIAPSGRVYRGRYELRYPLPDYDAVDVEFNPRARK
jgi:hypothetical protein